MVKEKVDGVIRALSGLKSKKVESDVYMVIRMCIGELRDVSDLTGKLERETRIRGNDGN